MQKNTPRDLSLEQRLELANVGMAPHPEDATVAARQKLHEKFGVSAETHYPVRSGRTFIFVEINPPVMGC